MWVYRFQTAAAASGGADDMVDDGNRTRYARNRRRCSETDERTFGWFRRQFRARIRRRAAQHEKRLSARECGTMRGERGRNGHGDCGCRLDAVTREKKKNNGNTPKMADARVVVVAVCCCRRVTRARASARAIRRNVRKKIKVGPPPNAFSWYARCTIVHWPATQCRHITFRPSALSAPLGYIIGWSACRHAPTYRRQ